MNNKLRYAMYPEAYLSGRLLCQVPTTTDGDFNVVRNSIATRVNKDGLVEVMDANVPRLDYSDGGCPKLLTEESSTNLITYSEDFSQGYWVKQSSSVVANQSISPNGANNAFLYNSTSNTFNFLQGVQSVSTSDFFTLSVFIKKGTANKSRLSLSGTAYTSARNVEFDLVNGTFTETSGFTRGTIKELSNGWYLCSVGGVPNTIGSLNCRIQAIGDNNNSSLYIWGSQFEKSESPSSYVPTNGSGITRQADQVNNNGTQSIYNSQEGVLFVDTKIAKDSGVQRFALTNLSNQYIRIEKSASSNNYKFQTFNGIFNNVVLENANVDLQNKVAGRYNVNTIDLFFNGIKISSGQASKPTAIQRLQTENYTSTKTKTIQHYDYLSDLEMEALTGYDSYSEMTSQFNFNVL